MHVLDNVVSQGRCLNRIRQGQHCRQKGLFCCCQQGLLCEQVYMQVLDAAESQMVPE